MYALCVRMLLVASRSGSSDLSKCDTVCELTSMLLCVSWSACDESQPPCLLHVPCPLAAVLEFAALQHTLSVQTCCICLHTVSCCLPGSNVYKAPDGTEARDITGSAIRQVTGHAGHAAEQHSLITCHHQLQLWPSPASAVLQGCAAAGQCQQKHGKQPEYGNQQQSADVPSSCKPPVLQPGRGVYHSSCLACWLHQVLHCVTHGVLTQALKLCLC